MTRKKVMRSIAIFLACVSVLACAANLPGDPRVHVTGGYMPENTGLLAEQYEISRDDQWYAELGLSFGLNARPAARDSADNARLRAYVEELQSSLEALQHEKQHEAEPSASEPDTINIGGVAFGTTGAALIGALIFAIIKWRASKPTRRSE